MIVLALLLAIPITVGLVQNALLGAAGRPWRWQIGGHGLPDWIVTVNRVTTNIGLLGVLVGYPLLRGVGPLAYYRQTLPLAPAWRDFSWGLGAAVLYLSLLYLAWLQAGLIRCEIRHKAGRLVQRLALVPLTAVVAAFVEELVFRGALLRGLLDDLRAGLPAGTAPTVATSVAVLLGALVFAAAHYMRAVKRYWTFPGHVMLGLLLCVAYVHSGSLWLPLGLHAGGILVLLTLRPFVRYQGPAWLTGASIYPYAGVVGVAALGLLTLSVWQHSMGP